MPEWLVAGLWGLLGGGALVLGAAVAWVLRVPQRVVAVVMAFGAGVLLSRSPSSWSTRRSGPAGSTGSVQRAERVAGAQDAAGRGCRRALRRGG